MHHSIFSIVLCNLPPQTNIRLKDVRFISKQRTALVFPNAIQVETGDKKVGRGRVCGCVGLEVVMARH